MVSGSSPGRDPWHAYPSSVASFEAPSHRRAALVLVFSTLTAIPAFGQSPSHRLQEFGESARGFEMVPRPLRGELKTGANLTVTVVTHENLDYMVVGFCGEGCDNLDLTLADSTGREVASDRLPDAQPILSFSADATEALWISVDMVSCSAETCEFAVGFFSSSRNQSNRLADIGASRMGLFKKELGELGYTQVGEDFGGTLGHEQGAEIPIPLEAGNEYRIGAVCDDDCMDLDLILRGPEGDTIASDILRDAFPVLVHSPAEDGEYNLTVHMAACFIEPCGFRVAAMSRARGLGPGGIPVDGTVVSEAVRRGRLEFPDDRLPEGGLFDAYSIPADAGQTIIVDLRSDDFDTYLAVEAPNGDRETNDDYDMETGHSHVELIAPEEGSYKIVVTTFSPEGAGDYFLQIAVVQRSR